jgi:hypothetical protein
LSSALSSGSVIPSTVVVVAVVASAVVVVVVVVVGRAAAGCLLVAVSATGGEGEPEKEGKRTPHGASFAASRRRASDGFLLSRG